MRTFRQDIGLHFRHGRLNHPYETVASHRRIEHRQIARLEDVQWELSAGEQQHAGDWKDRDRLGKVVGCQISGISHLH